MRVFLVAVVLMVPALALAQDEPRVAQHAQILDTVHVYGHRPSPVTLFVPRAHVRFERTDAEHHAVDRVIDSVSRAPF